MRKSRRWISGAVLSSLAMCVAGPQNGLAGDYPTRPVSIITPAPAGAGPDVIARIVGDRLTHIWKEQVLIVNRPGGGGLIGAQAAAAAKPDGYTLYMPISSTFVVLPERNVKMPLDLRRDIVPIGLIAEQPMLIAVNPKLGIKTLAELIALAKKQPGKLMFGGGAGGLPHMTGAAFQQRAGIDLNFVPYTKQTQATQDAVGGTLQVVVESMSGLAGVIQSGRLIPLAVASAKRLPNAADIPTVAEAFPNVGTFEARGWFALTAPTGTPAAIIDKVSQDLRSILAQPDLQEKFTKLGTYARPMTPAELAVFIHSEQELWRPIVRRILASPS